MVRRALALLLVAAPVLAADLAVDGPTLRLAGRPAILRGLIYPLQARRDGHPFDAAAAVEQAQAAGLNLVAARIAEGPTVADAEALIAAARAAGLPVAVEPLGPPEAAARLAARLGGDTTPAWLSPPILFENGLGFGDWSDALRRARQAADQPALAVIPCAPPDWLLAARALRPAAEHPDLYRTTALRAESVSAEAGEYLLVPTPGALRLAVYAALGSGAKGLLFDHAGHLAGGDDPFTGADRAATIARLIDELALLEPWLAECRLLDPPATPAAVRAALFAHGDDRLLLLWRQRPLDGRQVGGAPQPPFEVTVPWRGEAPRVYALAPDALRESEADRRDAGIRLSLPRFDLTAAFLLTREPQLRAQSEVAAALPRTATRSVLIAGRRWAKVDHTVTRLEAQRRGRGARRDLAGLAGLLVEASEALAYGYLRSALELGDECERRLREIEARTLESFLADQPPGAGGPALLCFATLPGLAEPNRPPPTAPLPLTAEAPLSLDFEALEPGAIPERWHALEGFDQTVRTLRVVAEGGQFLRWLPTSSAPGALYLPFSPRTELTVSLRARVAAGADRLIALAPAAGAAPLAGLRLRPDGSAVSWPRAGEPVSLGADWVKVELRLAQGGLTATVGDRPVSAEPLPADSAGALVLAVLGGATAAVDLDDLSFR